MDQRRRARAVLRVVVVAEPAAVLRDELDALATVVEDHYGKPTRAGLPKELADRLLQDFHSWMLSHYRLTSERD